MPDNVDCAIAPNGDVYLLETGGRIVRCGNALTGDRTPEVIYLGKERMDGLYAGPDGSLHGVGVRYHTNAGGAWHKEKIPRPDPPKGLVSVWAANADDVWVGGTGELFHRAADGAWTQTPFGKPSQFGAVVHALGGRAPNDLYAVGGEVAHFDGTSWTPVTMPSPGLFLDVVPREHDTLIVSRNNVNGDGELFVARGAEVELVALPNAGSKTKFYGVAAAGDLVYLSTGGPLLSWDGKELRTVVTRGGWKVVAANGVVATGGTHLPEGGKLEYGAHVLVDGSWQFWPSPPKDAKPAEPPKASKKKASSPKL